MVSTAHESAAAAFTVIKEFERHQIWLANDSRMVPIYNKLIEIESQLIYANILDQSYPRVGVPNSDEIKIIENLFKDEITFLFYMSLDTQFVITRSYKYRSHGTKSLEDKLIEMPFDLREVYDLGSPQERLMAIFSKDSDIKNWFSVWIADIIEYRKETSKIMSDFYDQIMNLNRKRKSNQRPRKGVIIHSTPEGIRTKVLHEEYNITKICIN